MTQSTQERDDVEFTLTLPAWLDAAVQRRRAVWTRVDAVAVVGIGAHLALLAVVVGRGGLYLDDLRRQGATVGQSLPGFVGGPVDGPFAPLPDALIWFLAQAFPLAHQPAVIVTLLVRLVLAIAFWRVVRRILGPRPVALLPLGLLLLAPALLPATAWFQAAITTLACSAFAVWAVDAFVAWQLQRSRWSLATLALTTLLACCCYALGAVLPLLLLAVHGVVLAGDTRHPRPTWGSALLGAGVSAVAVVVFFAGYLTRSGAVVPGTASGGPGDAAGLAWDALRQAVPAVLGGPFAWSYPRPYLGVSEPDATVMVFVAAAALVAVAFAGYAAPARATRAAALLPAVLLPLALAAAVTRADAVGPLFSSADGLVVLLLPFLLLAVGLAASPWQVGAHRHPGVLRLSPAEQQVLERAAAAGVTLRSPRRAARRPGPREVDTVGVAAAVALAAVMAGSAVSTVTFTRAWWDNPTAVWLTQVRLQLAGAEAFPRILATPLPFGVVPASMLPTMGSNAPLVRLLRPDARFHDADGQVRAIDAAGRLLQPYATTLGESTRTRGCVVSAEGARATTRWVRLPRDVPYLAGAQIEVGFLLSGAGRVEVSMQTPDGERIVPVRFGDGGDEVAEGPHRVNVPVPVGVTVRAVQVTLQGADPTAEAARACLSSARVWAPFL